MFKSTSALHRDPNNDSNDPLSLSERYHSTLHDLKTTMPVQWTTVDTRNALISSVVPVGLGLASYIACRRGGKCHEFYESSLKPNFARYSPLIDGTADLLSLTPLGYASYMVYKHGGGFDYTDTSCALGLYAASMLLQGSKFCCMENRNYKSLAVQSGLLAAVATATAVAFYKIDERAGWLVAPYVAWSIYKTLLSYKLYKLNTH